VQEYLPALKSREMTNREVAELLGINEQHLSRVLAELEFEKDPAVDRKALKAATAAKKANIAPLSATLSPEDAAREAGVSLRPISRYIDKAKKAAA